MSQERKRIFPSEEDLRGGWLGADYSRLDEPSRRINGALIAFWYGDLARVAEELWDLVVIEEEPDDEGDQVVTYSQQHPEAIYLLGVFESLEPDPSQAMTFLSAHRGLTASVDFEIEKLAFRDAALCPVTPDEGSNDYALGWQIYVAGSSALNNGDLSGALRSWGLGALHGSTESTYAIGLQAARDSDFLTAEACWTHLSALGHGASMLSLGNLYERTVGPFLAKYWWDAALKEGSHERQAGAQLSGLEFYDEELAKRLSKASDRWWREDST